ncbi:biotin transporter BioY [Paenibacillus sp. sptzw28]|uniref:biotin transporter BioY n=1 Tax=Paenibacillus sp. sptzw28 TaxID=715179 RepID=UPI001C6E5E1B|nr:biotin transporter BioY [Paenibacillus sp. sptzw28]QYR22456.1 biotin transporter BioY [Paenibacillus sp. sptzw28]
MPSIQSTSANVQSNQAYRVRGLVFTALFAALFIAFSSIQFPVWYTPVPITLQTLAVMLAGGLLGATYGFWSIALVIALAGTGLPLLHGNGGLSLLFGHTAGFIWMFPFAALLIGWVSDRLFRSTAQLNTRQFIMLLAAIIGFGVLLEYASGVPWLAYKFDLTIHKALIAGCYPFLPVDIVKSVVAAILIRKLRPYLPRLRPAAR